MQALFEAHLTVTDVKRAMHFYGEILGLEFAAKFDEPLVAFYWIGGRGQSMLGLWGSGAGLQRLNLHVAFRVKLSDVLEAPKQLRLAKIQPLDFARNPTAEAVVIGWMPAAAVYFHDPDGNLLEFLAILPDAPRPEVGVIPWSQWRDVAKG